MPRLKNAPTRGVLRTATAGGRQGYRHDRYHPSSDLEPYVEHYWSVRWDLRGMAPAPVEILPHPSIHMTFDQDAGGRITGVARGKCSLLLENEGRVFAVKFKPGGFYPFAGIPLTRFTDIIVPVDEVFGAEGDTLQRDVLRERSDSSRIAVVERFLRRLRPEQDENAAFIASIVYAVAGDRTVLTVDDLVTRYRMTRRTLQRRFAKYVGVSPKWVIQRYRLHEAAEQLAAGGAMRQTELALSLGYSDQAHFVRDFKAAVGISPAAYASVSSSAGPSHTG